MKKIFFVLVLLPQLLWAQVEISRKADKQVNGVVLASAGSTATVLYDASDYEVVHKVAGFFAADVERVTGKQPSVVTELPKSAESLVLMGTLGKNRWIDRLVAEGKLEVSNLKNQWERYQLITLNNPFPGVKSAVVIVGSDRRATAYGAFGLSEAIGVSPWYWWADVPVKKSAYLAVRACHYTSTSPAVKYRGIFINDEDWGLFQWSSKTFDPQRKNIGPKTYEKVFELMLRLKLNLIWPAMHEISAEFASIPENIELADAYGIVAGSSHCEPMLCNNCHWNQKEKGPWNYSLNKDTIYNYWMNSVTSRSNKEAVWTIGIRGIHDQGMQRPPNEVPDRIKLVENVFVDQRQMIDRNVTKEFGDIQQCFVPYKEVLPLYDAGLKVPDDVTIVWVDDNFGYTRRLGSPQEGKRSGGAGIYWHLSYYGGPHSYLWLNTTPPALMWEELHKAYENDVRKIWVINVGDIKPMEIGIDYFSKMAWNTETIGPASQPTFLRRFAAEQFGEKLAAPVADLLSEYYRLGSIRKPEEMNRYGWAMTLSNATASSLTADYQHLLKSERAIEKRIRPEDKDAYFQLVGFSARILGASGLVFMADRDIQRGVDTLRAHSEVERLRQYIKAQVDYYNNEMTGGKWKHMMPGMETAKNLTAWNSQVRWPWGETTATAKKVSPQPDRVWREAASANRLVAGQKAQWVEIPGLGYGAKAMALKPATIESSWKLGDPSAPAMVFNFTTKQPSGEVLLQFLPTFRIYPGMQLRVSVAIDGQTPVEVEVPGSNGKEDENGPNRSNGIMNNAVQARLPLTGLTPGNHVLTLSAMDPGVVVDRISFY
jgi:hypothetical protein